MHGAPDDLDIELQRLARLTRSERRVLELLAQGLAPKQAAWEMCVAISTVRSHIAAAKRKTGAHAAAARRHVRAERRSRRLEPREVGRRTF